MNPDNKKFNNFWSSVSTIKIDRYNITKETKDLIALIFNHLTKYN